MQERGEFELLTVKRKQQILQFSDKLIALFKSKESPTVIVELLLEKVSMSFKMLN